MNSSIYYYITVNNFNYEFVYVDKKRARTRAVRALAGFPLATLLLHTPGCAKRGHEPGRHPAGGGSAVPRPPWLGSCRFRWDTRRHGHRLPGEASSTRAEHTPMQTPFASRSP